MDVSSSPPLPPGRADARSASDRPDAAQLARFGDDFLRLILHQQRVTESIDRVLGEGFTLGPMGAGPGRRFAKATAHGTFKPSYGHALEDDLGYQIFVPVAVVVDLDLSVEVMRFLADVVLPLRVTVRIEEPLTVLWEIAPPSPDDVHLQVRTEKVRSAVLQRTVGLDGELRRFIVRFVARELDKPHVHKARRIPLVSVIDAAWPTIAAQFLPNSPADRLADPEAR